MASTIKFVCALLVLCLIEKAYCQCKPGDFTVTQKKTGAEFQVTITNKCYCTQLEVTLSCDTFKGVQSVKPVGGLTKTGSSCLVNNGLPLYPAATYNFTYTSNAFYEFKPLSSQVACS